MRLQWRLRAQIVIEEAKIPGHMSLSCRDRSQRQVDRVEVLAVVRGQDQQVCSLTWSLDMCTATVKSSLIYKNPVGIETIEKQYRRDEQ